MRKIIRKVIAVMLCVACIVQFSGQAFAAGIFKTYVKEVFLSYGSTPEEAKKWLTDNGYEVVDYNLNEGADSALSRKRAVYLGYKTTKDADEALTDMKLMNMNGNYSVLDYQLLLQEQAANIRTFINDFLVAVSEYRENYKKGQARAVAAHDLLNLLYDDDTNTPVGDLLLEKIREEYSDEEFDALSDAEKAKHADMTTILMQSNSTSILAIEQVIALATDTGDSLWVERYRGSKGYDSMLDDLIENEGLTPSKAEAELSALYDEDAASLASKIPGYLEYLKSYTEAGVTFDSTVEELDAYHEEVGDTVMAQWYAVGTQYEVLKNTADEDGVSLLDIITDENNDLEGEDRYLLYSLAAALTDGQRACLELLTFYQIISMGISDDAAISDTMSKLDIGAVGNGSISIYEGIDRAVFGENVAMTSDANSLQNSTGKNVSQNWFVDGISLSTKILYAALGVSFAATIGSYIAATVYSASAAEHLQAARDFEPLITKWMSLGESDIAKETAAVFKGQQANAVSNFGRTTYWSGVWETVSMGMACVTLILLAVTLWFTLTDLIDYYNAQFTPIPLYIVHQGVNEDDERVYTYYKAAECNRTVANMNTPDTEMLGDFGDVNGDVGLQWVALYTTTDKAAGQPITAEFVVQYANSNIPNGKTPLSLFGEKSAQNLTNEKNGFTYSDGKNGIYLFYETGEGIFASSAITGGNYAIFAGTCTIILAIACIVISRKCNKKKEKEQ